MQIHKIVVPLDDSVLAEKAIPFEHPCNIQVGNYSDIAGGDIIVISAGVAQKPGETRLEMVKRNVAIFQQMIPRLAQVAPEAILVITTNPVDILTEATIRFNQSEEEGFVYSANFLKALVGQTLQRKKF